MGLIKKILFPLLLITAVIGGAVGADMMKNGAAASAKSEYKSKDKSQDKTSKKDGHEKKDAHGKKDKDADKKNTKKGKSKKGDDKGSHEDTSAANVNYLKFKRQFVTPVLKSGNIDALVIMNINLELESNVGNNIYMLEPKFRDAITREMLALSNSGTFGNTLTSAESYLSIQKRLLTAVRDIAPEGIKNVLILDLARQDT